MANDPTDPEYSLIQVNKTLSEIIVSICNCGISPKPWPVCTIQIYVTTDGQEIMNIFMSLLCDGKQTIF